MGAEQPEAPAPSMQGETDARVDGEVVSFLRGRSRLGLVCALPSGYRGGRSTIRGDPSGL
ncbi:hypothetical protein ACQP2E_19405 [Actinoplanes sp. CA-015351]|uniref:hypothetical protein n=1 Tax=Actinoplanes sp. CA-015351 TaxID=3239897 RepID=UPI003D995EB2